MKRLYIDVFLHAGNDTARAVIEGSHTNLIRLTHNDQELRHSGNAYESTACDEFRAALRSKTIADFVDMVECIEDHDYDYIKRGIEMNLRISKAGQALRKVSHYISELVVKKYREADVLSSCEVVNSYIKCFTGSLSPLCGCAIAAGVGAAVSIVYQRAGKDMLKITLAVNNLMSDLGGMLCDGAKAGCALKMASSTNSLISSAYMALNGHGITQQQEGFVGQTAEHTIRNLSKISVLGMSLVDDTILEIMIDKVSSQSV